LALPLLCLLAAGIGTAAWIDQPSLASLALLLLLPLLFFNAGRHSAAFCVAFAYYGTATRAVPGIISYFFPSLATGVNLLLWAGHCTLLALPWALLWVPSTAGSARRAGMVLLALALLTVPPIGLFHWGSPLMAAGLLFPGWRWAGLSGTAALLALLAVSQWKTRRIHMAVAGLFALSLAANVRYRPPAPPPGWHPVSLQFGKSPELWSDDMAARRDALVGMALLELSKGAKVVIFPESISGSSRRSQQALWQRVSDAARQRGATVLFGEETWNAARTGFRNALVGYGTEADGGAVAVSSMVPMPIGDWKFGLEEGADTNIFGSDVIDLHGQRVAFSMCYEDFLLWPHRGLLAGRAGLLVSATNQWPSSRTSAESAQDRSRAALARLAGVALLTAKNH
jgi:hypothetical protein